MVIDERERTGAPRARANFSPKTPDESNYFQLEAIYSSNMKR